MRSFLSLLILVAIVVFLWFGWQRLQPPAAPWPESASEHPFANTVDDIALTETAPAPDAPPPPVEEATGVRSYNATISVGDRTVNAVLEATPEVSDIWLEHLAATMEVVPFEGVDRADLEPFYGEKGKLLKGAAEVRLPAPVITGAVTGPQTYTHGFTPNARVNGYYLAFPDNWAMVRPSVIAPSPDYSGDPMPEADDSDVGRATAALTGSWTTVRGQLQCQAPDWTDAREIPFAEVTVNDSEPVNADAEGNFEITGSFTDVTAIKVRYNGHVTASGGAEVGPRIAVWNDFHNPRTETFDVPANNGSGDVLVAALTPSSSLDCELYVTGAEAIQTYHDMTGLTPNAGGLRIKRWEGIGVGTPHTYHDYVAVARNWRSWCCEGAVPDWFRRQTLYHEFGHVLRHSDDGDVGHWGWDNFRWAYARNHNGTEIFNEQYAFNEGWGQFWACTRNEAAPYTSPPLDCPDISDVTYLHTDAATHMGVDLGGDQHQYVDWVEVLVGRRLVEMANEPGVTIADMAQLSRDNPGNVHTLRAFERVYCARFTNNNYCSGGLPSRTKTSCPPQYHDDGSTCRLDNIIAKPSYGRGAGRIPRGCDSGENDAGLCYEECRPGFDGVGPVCWRDCPPGMHDDGAFCRRDVEIIGSNNRSCPWYDVCGVTFARGCSTCPAGYQNDGCTCRIDAWIFAKETYGRGAGTLPTQCGTGREYDAGLCYQFCRPGFNGVGPVCWGSCPEGYADHGGTCYRDPQVITKD